MEIAYIRSDIFNMYLYSEKKLYKKIQWIYLLIKLQMALLSCFNDEIVILLFFFNQRILVIYSHFLFGSSNYKFHRNSPLKYWIFPFHQRLLISNWRLLTFNLPHCNCRFALIALKFASLAMWFAHMDKGRTKNLHVFSVLGHMIGGRSLHFASVEA